MLPVLVVLVYFIIGGIATAIVNKKKPEGKKARWTKYVVYLLIVSVIMTAIHFDIFYWAALIIWAIGLYEIINIGTGPTLLIGMVAYSSLAFMFIFFSAAATSTVQMTVYIVVLTFDGFSQIVGQLFGKRKLVPKISPGKTIEGLIGGAAIAVATAYFIWNEPIQGALICIAALAGDLLASFYKRKCGVKDYSNLIPGHGGVLDRFDSFIFVGATWALIYSIR